MHASKKIDSLINVNERNFPSNYNIILHNWHKNKKKSSSKEKFAIHQLPLKNQHKKRVLFLYKLISWMSKELISTKKQMTKTSRNNKEKKWPRHQRVFLSFD